MYASSVIPWQPELTTPLPVDHWLAPSQDTYFFCDLHADAEAFLRSLKLSYLVTLDSTVGSIELTTKGMHGQIIIGGDCFDKGPSNLALFKLIQQLRQTHCDLILLAGNHDVRIYAGLLAIDFMDNPKQAHFFVRMGRKTVSLLSEIYHEYCQDMTPCSLSEAEIKAALLPPENWFHTFPESVKDDLSFQKIQKEIRQIEKKQTDFIQACFEHGLTLTQVYQAAQMAKHLFIDQDGEFAWFFQNMDLVHVSGSYCFSHAGLDDQFAEKMKYDSIECLNQQFRHQMQAGQIFEMYYSEFGNVFRTKYRDNDWPLTEKGACTLKQNKIFAMVNGHRSHQQGQQLFVRQGLLNFECDTLINTNCRRKSNIQTLGEAVTIFYSDGMVSALSSDFPATKQFHPNQLKQH
ncbi:MAG: hypothetical protein DSZ27_06985 [Thiomicrospira sp.]|nr:MAG: hypothetical protein DSZ27_06985 [Thiomicrospira sp.]